MTAPLVIFAIGNPSRGDDALGPLLSARLRPWLETAGLAATVELIEDFQLNIEHALDLVGRRLAVFIDAGAETPGPFVFARILPSTATTHSTHALAPETVLHVYRLTEGREPPPAFVLCIRGEGFALGDGLSVAAESALAQAEAWLKAKLLLGEAWQPELEAQPAMPPGQ